jgi:hypothetical protein
MEISWENMVSKLALRNRFRDESAKTQQKKILLDVDQNQVGQPD